MIPTPPFFGEHKMIAKSSTLSRGLSVGSAFVFALTLARASYAGPTWDNDLWVDAGNSASMAQTVTQTGTVMEIKGRLSTTGFGNAAPDYSDMFLIQITAPTIFRISTAGGESGGSAAFDSQLFVFKGSGSVTNPHAFGVLGNADFSSSMNGAMVQSQSNDGSGFVLTDPGLYYIAISMRGVNPLSTSGLIWPNMPTGVIGFGNFDALTGWAVDPANVGGEYSIRTVGIEGVPAPGALALLALAGLARRSRRA